jgi:secreted trypsin-like serine protease
MRTTRHKAKTGFVLLLLMLLGAASWSSLQAQAPTGEATLGPLIVGGEAAAPGELPWQVLVSPAGNLCGGSLIDAEWVLTAAHCVVDDFQNPLDPSEVQVGVGEYDLNGLDDNEQVIDVDQVIVHPGYDANIFDNDIALLHLAAPVVFGDSVGLISLVTGPQADALTAPGISALVSGWGSLEEGGDIATILQKVRLPLVSNEVCQAGVGVISDNMICAGFAAGGKDACQGDSGGPLVVPDGAGWLLGGIVSFGSGCAQPEQYGVYTRVARYQSWIGEHVAALAPTPTEIPTDSPTPITTPSATETPVANEHIYLPLAWRQAITGR